VSVASPLPTVELRAESVDKFFRGVKALKDVSIKIARGEIVGLIGPNGSGKTTLINVLSGVLPLTSGQVFLGDQLINNWSADRRFRHGIARSYQNIRLFNQLSVVQNVEVPLVAHSLWRSVRSEALNLLEKLALDGLASSRSASLAYGAQRRLEIARALGGSPHFLLLDEPAAGMNDTETAELVLLLRAISSETGCGMLVIDHDIGMILDLCHRVIVLNEGRVIFKGLPEATRHSPIVQAAYIGEPVEERGGKL